MGLLQKNLRSPLLLLRIRSLSSGVGYRGLQFWAIEHPFEMPDVGIGRTEVRLAVDDEPTVGNYDAPTTGMGF